MKRRVAFAVTPKIFLQQYRPDPEATLASRRVRLLGCSCRASL